VILCGVLYCDAWNHVRMAVTIFATPCLMVLHDSASQMQKPVMCNAECNACNAYCPCAIHTVSHRIIITQPTTVTDESLLSTVPDESLLSTVTDESRLITVIDESRLSTVLMSHNSALSLISHNSSALSLMSHDSALSLTSHNSALSLTSHGLCCRMGGPGAPGAEETGDFSDGEDDVAANTAAQAAARAAFAEDKVADTFYSSDEDESEERSSSVTGSFVTASGPSLSEPSKKFRVVIKV